MGQTYGAQTSTNGFIVMWFPNAIMGLTGLILFLWLVKNDIVFVSCKKFFPVFLVSLSFLLFSYY